MKITEHDPESYAAWLEGEALSCYPDFYYTDTVKQKEDTEDKHEPFTFAEALRKAFRVFREF